MAPVSSPFEKKYTMTEELVDEETMKKRQGKKCSQYPTFIGTWAG